MSKRDLDQRVLNQTNPGDKRLQRRDSKGRFADSDDLGRSLAQDQKRDASEAPPRGEGDKGDRKH